MSRFDPANAFFEACETAKRRFDCKPYYHDGTTLTDDDIRALRGLGWA